MAFRYSLLMITAVTILLLGGTAVGDELTLDDCLELALQNHQNMVEARGQVEMYNGYLWNAAGSAFLPYISASGSVRESHASGAEVVSGIETGRIVSGVSKFYGLGISGSMTLFNGGRSIFNYLGARADKKRMEYLLESTEQDIILTVKQTYFNYLKAQDNQKNSEEAVKRGEEQYKLASSRYEVGAASKSDVLKAQVQYGNDKLMLLAAENAVKTTHANLCYLIGIDVNSGVEFSTQFQQREYENTEENALKYGLAHHPGLLASVKNVTSAQYDVKSAWGRFLPSVSINVSRDYSGSTWSEVSKLDDIDGQWTISTSISIPIFEQFGRKYELSRSRALLNNARVAESYTRNYIAAEIKRAFLEQERTKQALVVAEETVAAAKEDFNLVQEKYNLGAATILEVLDAQVSLVEAENSLVEARYDYNLSVASLEKAMGVKR
ncbi:MAG: TolC family protein [candidate division Zixibacteria bacterium]|nr:TolC family protein [candidate division Zixibacteria bacterium]